MTSYFPLCDFPSDVLKWMKENAEPKMAVKLMKCHKCFKHFPEFQYFVVKEIEYIFDGDKWFIFTLDEEELEFEGPENIAKMPKKLWITEDLSFYNFPKPISSLIPKIAVCDIEGLKLVNQNIFYNEFKFLIASGNIETLQMINTKIELENGEILFFDEILKLVKSVKTFYYYNVFVPFFSPDFIKNFRDIDASKLEVISLQILNYSVFEIIFKFMDHNPHIEYRLYFLPDSISNEEHKLLQKYVDKIIDVRITDNPPPYIEFPGQTLEQLQALNFLISQYKEKKNSSL